MDAKRAARNGNLEPLRKILAKKINDPEIEEFLAKPKTKKRKRHKDVGKTIARNIERAERHRRVEMIRRIREITQEQIEQTRVPAGSVFSTRSCYE
jgi:hypothetical protein